MLSVIVVSFNTKDLTLECLELVEKASENLKSKKDIDTEVIVIDNASADGSAAAISERFPHFRLISNKENTGFAKANNMGMTKAKGDWILLLNSDALVKNDTFTKILEYVDNHLEVDVVGCRLLNKDRSTQPSYGYFPTLARVSMWLFFIHNFPIIRKFIKAVHVRDLSRYKRTTEVDWVTGAFLMIRQKVFQECGGIDENYFMYGEEMEWQYRIKQKGFRVWFTPVAETVHIGAASTKSTGKMFIGEMKGLLYWFSKHKPKWQRDILPWIMLPSSLYKWLAWKIKGNQEYARANWELFNQIKNEIVKSN